MKFILRQVLGKYLNVDLENESINVELTSGLVQLTDVTVNVEVRRYSI